MDSMKFFWGLVVLAVGIGLVGVNVGWWDASIWSSVLTLWPLVIMALGLQLMIRNEKLLAFTLLILFSLAIAFVVTTYKGGENPCYTRQLDRIEDLIINELRAR